MASLLVLPSVVWSQCRGIRMPLLNASARALLQDGEQELQPFHPVAALLSYLTKAPLVPPGTPVVNALAKQRAMLENVMRACVGLQPENNMMLEARFWKVRKVVGNDSSTCAGTVLNADMALSLVATLGSCCVLTVCCA